MICSLVFRILTGSVLTIPDLSPPRPHWLLTPEDWEHSEQAVALCPWDDPLHLAHDGCPSCDYPFEG